EHLKDIQKFFDRIRENGLSLKLAKCKFFQSDLIYLGHRLSKDGVRPDDSKVEVIANMKPPTSIKGVRRFLGMTGYYRRFIQNYADIASPLHKLLAKNSVWKWNPSAEEAFEVLKRKLM